MLPTLCKKLNRSSQRRGRPIPPGPPSLENRSLGSAGAFSLRWTPADAPRPLRVENGATDPCSGGGGGSREVVQATRSALGVRRAAWARPCPPPPTVRSLIHSHIRPFARGRVRLRSVFSLPRPRRPPVVGAEPSARPAASRPSAGWCGAHASARDLACRPSDDRKL